MRELVTAQLSIVSAGSTKIASKNQTDVVRDFLAGAWCLFVFNSLLSLCPLIGLCEAAAIITTHNVSK